MAFSGDLKELLVPTKAFNSLTISRTPPSLPSIHWYVCASVQKDLWTSKATTSFRREKKNWFVFLLSCNTFIPQLSKYFLLEMQIRIIKCNWSFIEQGIFSWNSRKLQFTKSASGKALFLHDISVSVKSQWRERKVRKNSRKYVKNVK